jgi:hypothetical protein
MNAAARSLFRAGDPSRSCSCPACRTCRMQRARARPGAATTTPGRRHAPTDMGHRRGGSRATARNDADADGSSVRTDPPCQPPSHDL